MAGRGGGSRGVVHGTVKGLLGLVSTLVLIVLIAAAGLAYRLSQGPLSLSFLTPQVESALSDLAGGLAIELDETVLAWDADHHTLAIQLHNVRALGANKRVLAAVPGASVSFSGPALLTGRFVLRGIRLIRPHLQVLRKAQGGFALGLGDEMDADAAAMIDEAVTGTVAPPAVGNSGDNRTARVFGLDLVEVEQGNLDLDDPVAKLHWRAPRIDLSMTKTASGISLAVRGPLLTEAGQTEPGMVSANGLYHPDTATLSGTLHWTGLRPSSIAPVAAAMQLLARFQLTTAGTADVTYAPSTGLASLAFDMSGGSGTIDATPWGGKLRVGAMAVRGKLTDRLDNLVLDEFHVDLGGPKIALSGHANGINGTPHVEATARADEVPMALLPTLWPAAVAPNPREWITTNMSGGTIRHAEMKLVAAVPLSGTAAPIVDTLTGSIQGDGVAVHYLGTLPSVRGVAAAATFDKDTMTITAKSGAAGGVTVKGGTIRLTGLSSAEQVAHFNLEFEAAVPDVLKLIDAKPLGFTSALGFDPAHTKGDATIALDMQLPLVKTVRLNQVKLKVRAKTQGLGVPKAAFGLDLSGGVFDVDVDPHGMDVSGAAKLGTIPIDLKWRENFTPAAFASRYQVKASLDEAGRKAVGLNDPAFQAPVIVGAVPVEATATMMSGGRGDLALKADLTPIAMRLPGLNWSKPAGKPGTAEAEVRLNAGGVAAIPHFTVTAAGGLEMRGDVAFDTGTHPRRISLGTAKWGRTDLKGTILFKPDGSLGIDMSGASFDASELVGGGSGEHHIEAQQALSVSAKLGRVWLSEDGSIRNVAAVLARGPQHWRFIRVDGVLEKGQPLHVDVRPTDNAHRSLKVTGTDAGAVFAAFGLFKNMRGGALAVDGTYDDSDPHEPLAGTVKIGDYRVVNAPLLAKVLTVASLTGTLDVMSGDGIRFDKADVPFTLVDGLLTLKDAHTAGTELGVTANGQVDLDNDIFAIQGTIVPAYAINSLFGKIPVIGDLLTGEKGGGLIAFNYSVKGPAADPSISVNPLSALTPGFLRGLFDVFDNGSGTTVKRPDAGKGGTPPPRPDSSGDR